MKTLLNKSASSCIERTGRLSLIGLGLAAAFVAGGLIGTLEAASAAPEQKDLTVYAELSFQSPVQMITAQKKGFFEKFGLNVTAKYYQSGSDVPPGMIGGSIVLAHGGLANPLVVSDQGFPVKIIAMAADWARSTAIVVQPELKDAKPADLAGKTLVAPDIPVLRMFWINWAKLNSINPGSVKWLNAAPSDALAAFVGKRADILLMWAPAMNKAIESGGVKWQDGRTSYRPGAAGPAPVYFNWGVVFASADWYGKNMGTVEAYLSGLYMAQAYMKCHADEVAQIVSKEAKLDPALGKTLMGLNDYAVDMDANFVTAAQGASDFYSSVGMLKKSHDLSKEIDATLIDKVSKSVKIPPEWMTCS